MEILEDRIVPAAPTVFSWSGAANNGGDWTTAGNWKVGMAAATSYPGQAGSTGTDIALIGGTANNIYLDADVTLGGLDLINGYKGFLTVGTFDPYSETGVASTVTINLPAGLDNATTSLAGFHFDAAAGINLIGGSVLTLNGLPPGSALWNNGGFNAAPANIFQDLSLGSDALFGGVINVNSSMTTGTTFQVQGNASLLGVSLNIGTNATDPKVSDVQFASGVRKGLDVQTGTNLASQVALDYNATITVGINGELEFNQNKNSNVAGGITIAAGSTGSKITNNGQMLFVSKDKDSKSLVMNVPIYQDSGSSTTWLGARVIFKNPLTTKLNANAALADGFIATKGWFWMSSTAPATGFFKFGVKPYLLKRNTVFPTSFTIGDDTTAAQIDSSVQFQDIGNSSLVLTGPFSMDGCDTLSMNIGGNSSPIAGTDYDQIVVSGSASTIGLGGTLAINTLPDLSAGDSTTFTLIDNETGNAISGTFAGLADNSTFTVSGWTFSITYEGGVDSDNVQLTVVNAPTFTSPYLIENADSVTLSGLNLANGVQIINSHNITLTNDTIGTSGNPFDGVYVDGTSSNITISNDTISANGGAGVDIAGSSVLVSDNDIFGNFKGGVLVNGGSADTISGNTIGDGINLVGASNIVIQGNYVGVNSSGTALGNTYDGIFVDSGSSSITIGGMSSGQGNTIAYNGGSGVDIEGTAVTVSGNTIGNDSYAGVFVNGGSAVTIEYNTIGDGVSLTGAATVTVQGNFIGVDASGDPLGNQLNGVYVDPASTNISISSNTIAFNGGYGIAVTASDVTVTGNTISNDTFGGVLISGSDSDSITSNTIGDGVSLIGATNTVIQNNYIGVNSSGTSLDNPNDGIYVDAGSSTIMIGGASSGQGNTIADNGGAGVNINGAAVTVMGNTISNDSNGGVLVNGSDSDTISGNTIGDGVSLYSATNTVIQSNYIGVNSSGTSLDNPNDGIYVDAGSSTITISSNTIADNGGADVEIVGSAVSLSDNTISSNGVLVDGGSGVTLTGNTLSELTITSGAVTHNGSADSVGYLVLDGGTFTESGNLTVTSSYLQNGGTANVGSGATLDLAGSVYFNSGLLALQGGTLDTASTLDISSGATLAGAGTISGSVDNSGTVAIGAPYSRGTLTITGNYTQASGGQFDVTLDSNSLTALDHLMCDGTATLNGTLNVYLASGYTPAHLNKFEVLEYNHRSGTFATVNLPSYSGGFLTNHYDTFPDVNAVSEWAS